MVFYILNTEKQAMIWYTKHREKYLISSLIVSGLITPPDVVSQVIGGVLFIGTMEFLVVIDSVKQGYLPITKGKKVHS